MLSKEDTAKLLDLEDVIIANKELGRHLNVFCMTATRYFRCVNHKPQKLPEVSPPQPLT